MRRRKKGPAEAAYIPRAASIEVLARALLTVIGSTSNILIAFERLRELFPKLRLIVVDDDVMPTNEAKAYPKLWIIKIRKGMHEGLQRGNVRARWTLAHELAHILLQHPKASLPRARKATSSPLFEREADLFAASFLAPYNEMAKRCQTPEELRDLFQISLEAAQQRLKEFNLEHARQLILRELGLTSRSIRHATNQAQELESDISDTCEAILAVIKDTQSEKNKTEPFNGNLYGAARLAVVGGRLLLEAYRHHRTLESTCDLQKTATLANAILILKPIRNIGFYGKDAIAVKSNEQCALRVAELVLSLPRGALRNVRLPQPNVNGASNFESSYLSFLVRNSSHLVGDLRSATTFYNALRDQPYSSHNCLHLGDVKDIETLMEQFSNPRRH